MVKRPPQKLYENLETSLVCYLAVAMSSTNQSVCKWKWQYSRNHAQHNNSGAALYKRNSVNRAHKLLPLLSKPACLLLSSSLPNSENNWVRSDILQRCWKFFPAFCDMMPCRLVYRYQIYGRVCFLHLQGSSRRGKVDAYTPIYTVSYPAIWIPKHYHQVVCPPLPPVVNFYP